IALFGSSGQHLGKFDTDPNAEAYAIALHNQQNDLYGNPIVFVEALVNFQPIFHNKQFGGAVYPSLSYPYANSGADSSAGYLIPACRFPNLFDKTEAAWPSDSPWYTQFPMAAVIVNDLIAALNLL